MQTKSYELFWALLLILLFGGLYILITYFGGAVPAAQSLFGHVIGVLGFLLMVMTETLYTLRKRSQSARWGRMSSWLQFHIITGVLGPFLVLLHTSWKYNRLAGIATLLMILVVASGFFGRYIYTAIPRNTEGVELSEWQIEEQIRQIEADLGAWLADHPDLAETLGQNEASLTKVPEGSTKMVFGRLFWNWGNRAKWKRLEQGPGVEISGRYKQVRKILQTRNLLERQKRSLAFSRRLLSIWHSLHVPVALALFAAAAVHMAAALYYITLLH